MLLFCYFIWWIYIKLLYLHCESFHSIRFKVKMIGARRCSFFYAYRISLYTPPAIVRTTPFISSSNKIALTRLMGILLSTTRVFI